MWILINEAKPDYRYSLIEGQTYTVGRVPSNAISIGNDVSISRVHGTICVKSSKGDASGKTQYYIFVLPA